MVLSKVNKKLCLVIKETKCCLSLEKQQYRFHEVFKVCMYYQYNCAREICFNHQSEALPRFYVISVEFTFPDQSGAKPVVGLPYKSKQFEYCQQQNYLYLLMDANPFPSSFDGKDFVPVKIKVSYFS